MIFLIYPQRCFSHRWLIHCFFTDVFLNSTSLVLTLFQTMFSSGSADTNLLVFLCGVFSLTSDWPGLEPTAMTGSAPGPTPQSLIRSLQAPEGRLWRNLHRFSHSERWEDLPTCHLCRQMLSACSSCWPCVSYVSWRGRLSCSWRSHCRFRVLGRSRRKGTVLTTDLLLTSKTSASPTLWVSEPFMFFIEATLKPVS